MPTFSNVHAELDNNEIHPPRDFSLAETDTFLTKNPLGDIQWHDTYWQRPVLGFADANFPPLTLQQGDRYILFGQLSIGSTAIDTSIDTSMDTSIWMDTSMDSTGYIPTFPVPATPEPAPHHAWGDVVAGDVVEYFRTNSKDQPVFEWRAITPKTGYQVFNLADRETYYFSGSDWIKKASSGSSPNEPQAAGTYATLSALAAASDLVPGLRYLITDRDIILTATTKSSFSIEGDYSTALPSYGRIELVSGTLGSIDGIQVNGVNLLSGPVAFDTDLFETAALVVDEINNQQTIHGFQSVNIGQFVYISDGLERGETLNGSGVTVQTTSIVYDVNPFEHGANVGEHWFSVKYRFADDWIAEMADGRGNRVSCEPGIASLAGINPYKSFPWADENVTQNEISNAVLFGFSNGATITNNRIENQSIVMYSMTNGDTLSGNHIHNQSFVRVVTTDGCAITDNDISLSGIDLQVSGGQIASNKMVATNIAGHSVTLGYIALNTLNAVTMLVSGTTISDMLQNNMVDGEYTFTGAVWQMRKNNLINTDFTAPNADFNLSENEIVHCEIDISDATGNYQVTENHIKYNCTINLQRAQGEFRGNHLEHIELDGADTDMQFINNKVNNYSQLVLNRYQGPQFVGNDISSATITMEDSSGDFNWNKVYNGTVEMLRHTNHCTENIFTAATITSNDSGSNINNNIIDKSDVKLSNTNGEFSSNKATFYSTYDLDGYLGARVTINKLDSGSELVANGNTSIHGGVIVEEDTKLDISYQNNLLYDCYFKLPSNTIFLSETQISRKYNQQESTLEASVTIDSSGIIDLGSLDAAYSGVLWVTNTETLKEIQGTVHSPTTIVIRPQASQILTIDGASPHIKFASGVVNQPIDGNTGGFIVLRKGFYFVVTELFAG